jgi:hypothetical protein
VSQKSFEQHRHDITGMMTDGFDVPPKKSWNDDRRKCPELFHYFWDLVTALLIID